MEVISMTNPKEPLTGVIETDKKSYSFYLSNYSMVFLDTVVDWLESSTLKSIDSFAKAYTHNGHKMLIHIGKHNFPVTNTMKMGLSSYIVSTSNIFDYDISCYDGVEFVGGTLSKLKHPRALKTTYDKESKRTYIEELDDTQTFSFTADDFTCEVKIGSYTSEKRDLESKSIVNDRVYFRMMFNEKQTTSSVYKHYNKVCELLSFLTNRKNVSFDEMYLWKKDLPSDTAKHTGRSARVFISKYITITEKPCYHNLEFELLGDSIGKLLTILYSPIEREKSYSLNFYPEDDKSSSIVNNQMVRSVCSALECELEFVEGITNDEAKKIKALKKQLKPIIDAHKLSEDKLKEKTYSLIESSMSHWSMAASDQIKELYHRYDEEMKLIAEKSLMTVEDDDIDNFVKYRNDITHGSYRVLDRKIAFTTHILACLVYCCVLTRIGVSREKIKQWFNDGRLLR